MINRQLTVNAPDEAVSGADLDHRDKRVLVVDDDPVTLHLVQRYLTEDGWEVLTAENASDALRIVQNDAPPVLITDWIMPEMDGLELCRAIRRQAGIGFVYIIVLTARSETDRVVEAFQAGVDDYLDKPFEPRELLARVRAGRRIAWLVRTNCDMGQEIARRRRAEEELAAHRADLERLVEERSGELLAAERQMLQAEKLASLGQLAAGVAHEINTPIQYVGDNFQALSDLFDDLTSLVDKYRDLVALLRSEKVTAEALEDIAAAEKEYDLEYIIEDAPKAIEQGLEGVRRVAHIVRAMKDFSHVGRGELAPVDINHALESALTVTRNEYKYVADAEADFGELPMVECYASELNQVFLNLLVNASHAIADTGERGTITVRTYSDGDDVLIDVSDTGTGIHEEIRGRIFDPFFTTKEVGKGTGQGLNMAHQIVAGKHGGSLTFETEMGKGTTFTVRLPVKSTAASDSDPMGDEHGQETHHLRG